MLNSFFSFVVFGLNTIVVLTAVVLLVGILFILVALTLGKPHDPASNRLKYAFHHIFRDVGLAFLVAAIVTTVYGSTLDFNRVSDAISLMIGDNVPQSIWESSRTQIFQRDVLRGDYKTRWAVQWDSTLPHDQALLKVRIEYTLYGLKPQASEYTVRQELENIHLTNPDRTLPRFDKVTIVGGPTYEGESLKNLVKDGLLTLPPIPLKSWKKTGGTSELSENLGMRIIVERSEVINIPGVHSIVLSELTKNVTLEIEHPDDIKHELKQWFDRRSVGFVSAGGKYYTLDDVVLPGQSISVQFWKAESTSSAISSTQRKR